MTPNQQKEEISKAYVAAIAARCGFALGLWSQDQGGLDVTLGAASCVGAGHLAAPKIDLQIKCTSDSRRCKKKHVSWQFDNQEQYNTLVRPRRSLMLLVILVLPTDEAKWVEHSSEELILRRCAYYKRMNGEAESTASAPTAQVPYTNVFDPVALKSLMEQVSMGALP